MSRVGEAHTRDRFSHKAEVEKGATGNRSELQCGADTRLGWITLLKPVSIPNGSLRNKTTNGQMIIITWNLSKSKCSVTWWTYISRVCSQHKNTLFFCDWCCTFRFGLWKTFAQWLTLHLGSAFGFGFGFGLALPGTGRLFWLLCCDKRRWIL